MRVALGVIGAVAFLGGGVAHLVVRLTLRPRPGGDLDDIYYEFEDRHPGYRRYDRACRITFVIAALGALLLFVAGYVL